MRRRCSTPASSICSTAIADAAARTLEASLRLDADSTRRGTFWRSRRLSQGRAADARALLTAIPSGDEYGPAATALLRLMKRP